jgi:Zn-finger nucleic acid-binding protein
MRCPKCDEEMEEVTSEGVVVDRCTGCKGIWFDKGEAEQLSAKWIAEFIDFGNPEIGAEQDSLDTVPCPRCGETMKRFFELDALHLQFEQCDEHGQFFDAGEFTIWAADQHL